MEDKTMNRVQLLALSGLILAGSVAFAAEDGGPRPEAPRPEAPRPQAPKASFWSKVCGAATATKKAVWTDRSALSRTGEVVGLGAVLAAAIVYVPTFNKWAKKAQAKGTEVLKTVKESRKAQVITGSVVVGGAAYGVAEYKGYGLRAAYNKLFKKAA